MKHIIFALSILTLSQLSFADNSADNTRVNKRDQASHELTADQQMHGANDMNITRRIRQEIMKDGSYLTYAQNVKVITVNGKVTLKSPVRSEREQTSILKNARLVAGTSNVTNEMSIAREKNN